MAYESKHSGRRGHHRSSSNSDTQLKMLKQLKTEIETIRSRQREMYEIMLTYKQDMYDLKTQVIEALKGLPESPYIAGRLVPAPRQVDEFDLFEDVVKTYLHRQTLPPEETETEASEEDEAPKKRRRRGRKRRRKTETTAVSVETIDAENLEPTVDEPEDEVGEVDELVPNAELPEQAFEDTATIFREEVMTEELEAVFGEAKASNNDADDDEDDFDDDDDDSDDEIEQEDDDAEDSDESEDDDDGTEDESSEETSDGRGEKAKGERGSRNSRNRRGNRRRGRRSSTNSTNSSGSSQGSRRRSRRPRRSPRKNSE